MKMSQIFKDGKVVPVTLIKIKNDASFQEGELVKVTGVSRGLGFQGVVKRWGFGGGPQTHGQKNRLRAPGSSGPTAPQRVLKGRKMAGRMGGEQKTIRNLAVAAWDQEQKIVMIKGAVPGYKKSKIKIVKLGI